MPERGKRSPDTTGKKTLQERQNGKSLKLKVYTVAKMRTGPVDTHHAQELAKLTSTVVPLQRLKIQDDTLMEAPKTKLETEAPAPPKKYADKQTCMSKMGTVTLTNLLVRSINIIWHQATIS